MAKSYDWTQFRVHGYYEKPVREVYDMWATGAGLERFFIREAQFNSPDGAERRAVEPVQAGDRYLWRWIHDFELTGQVLAADPPYSVTYTFGGSMKVTIEIADRDGCSLVTLRQFDIPADSESDKASSHLNCRSCWVFFITNLKSVLEHGVDLREADPSRADCVAVHFQPPNPN